MGSKQKRDAGQPLPRSTSFLIQLGFIAVLTFVPTCASMATFPATTRLAAPLVCPPDTDHSVVMARWGGGSKGGSTLKWELYCVTREGFGTIPSTGKTVLALAVIYGGLAGILVMLLRLRGWLRSRSQGGQAHA